MLRSTTTPFVCAIVLAALLLSACSTLAPTSTPQPTATKTIAPTKALKPTSTPTRTPKPNLTATQQAQVMQAEVQSYFDRGYLQTKDGKFLQFRDFETESQKSSDYWFENFYLRGEDYDTDFANFAFNAHFKWSTAERNAGISGCGIVFAVPRDEDYYGAFLDHTKVLFVRASDSSGYPVGTTNGTGLVAFEDPFEAPAEADFTLIVKDPSAYVLVNDELIGEYTLTQNRKIEGQIFLSVMSGTDKDFGTRCEMSNVHIFVPNE